MNVLPTQHIPKVQRKRRQSPDKDKTQVYPPARIHIARTGEESCWAAVDLVPRSTHGWAEEQAPESVATLPFFSLAICCVLPTVWLRAAHRLATTVSTSTFAKCACAQEPQQCVDTDLSLIHI